MLSWRQNPAGKKSNGEKAHGVDERKEGKDKANPCEILKKRKAS